MIQFVPATRESVYARIALHGPGGSGKTFLGLLILHALCERVAVIDTERGRSRKYVGINGWQFDILEPHVFSPESLIEALAVAADTGHDGMMIDSGSHYWSGTGGMLERVDQAAISSGRGRDTFGAGWKEMSPIEKKMFDAVLAYPGHLVMTLRVKTDYLIEDVEKDGRTTKKIVKMGLRPDQRREFDYEFDLVGALDARDNTLTVMKSDIITIPQGSIIPKPGLDFADTIGDFCAQGAKATGPLVYRARALEPDITFDGLKELRDEVLSRGLGNAAVVDEHGRPTVLDELLTARARELTPRQQARTTRPAANPRSEKPKPEGAKAASEDELRKAVDYILNSKDLEAAEERRARAESTASANVEIDKLMTADDIEILGIKPDESVTLAQLADKNVTYWRNHKHGPRDTPDEETAA